jgi:hypothetical protein
MSKTLKPLPDQLQTIPGIGPSLAQDLRDLGIRRVADLERRDPERLYARLNRLRGVRQDPCVLYAFRCAVYYARTPRPRPELLKWWNWKDRMLDSLPELRRSPE